MNVSSPPLQVFSRHVDVTSDDIDALGHASNISFVRWIQDVAVAHSEAIGLSLSDYQGIGAVFVVKRHEIDYLRPALKGDRLELKTWIGEVRAASSLRHTEIVRTADGVPLARAATTWAFIDTRTGRPTRIPPDVRGRFGL